MLADDMKVVLATSFSFYLKAANFHWNIEGPSFPQYHPFLGDMYADVYDTIDPLAEYIRALNEYSPASLSSFSSLSLIKDQNVVLLPTDSFQMLFEDGNTLLNLLKTTFTNASAQNEQGIANFLAERIDAMQKHLWMIRSILKSNKG